MRASTDNRYSLRTLFAITAGFAFISFVAHWLIATGLAGPPLRLVLLILPWAVGSLVGMAIAIRRGISTLAGTMIGGTLGTLICPGTIFIYLYLNSMNGVRSLDTIGWQMGLAACGSGLLAAVVGILREGVTILRQ